MFDNNQQTKTYTNTHNIPLLTIQYIKYWITPSRQLAIIKIARRFETDDKQDVFIVHGMLTNNENNQIHKFTSKHNNGLGVTFNMKVFDK